MSTHIAQCADFTALFRRNPTQCLEPTAEYQRFRALDTFESRAERRDVRLQQRFTELDRRQSAQATRWARPKDILED